MVHLLPVAGEPGFMGEESVTKRAIADIKSLEGGGISGILIENWYEDSVGEFVKPETTLSLKRIISILTQYIHVPYGINVLNNDYVVCGQLALAFGASFIQLDVFADQVRSDFSYSQNAKNHPFEIHPVPLKIIESLKQIGAGSIPLIVFVQPKHYLLLEMEKSMQKSVIQAINGGASALIVTQETGIAPFVGKIEQAKDAAGNMPVGVGSGLNNENAGELMKVADFAIVGSYLKIDGDIHAPVDVKRVRKLTDKLKVY